MKDCLNFAPASITNPIDIHPFVITRLVTSLPYSKRSGQGGEWVFQKRLSGGRGDLQISIPQEFSISNLQQFNISIFQHFSISTFQDFKNFQDFNISAFSLLCKTSTFQRLHCSTSQHSKLEFNIQTRSPQIKRQSRSDPGPPPPPRLPPITPGGGMARNRRPFLALCHGP